MMASSEQGTGIKLEQQLSKLGLSAEKKLNLPGRAEGTFKPAILSRDTFTTNEIRVTQKTFPLFVVAVQNFTDDKGFQGELGVAFYITGTAEAPTAVNAFIVKGSMAHIDTSPNVKAAVKNGVLTLDFEFETWLLNVQHKAEGTLEVYLS